MPNRALLVYPGGGIIRVPNPGAPPPAIVPGTFKTFLAGWGLDTTLWGLNPFGDSVFSDANGVTVVTTKLDLAIATGAQMFCRATGTPNKIHMDTFAAPVNGRFVAQGVPAGGFLDPVNGKSWCDKFDEWYNEVRGVAGGEAKLRAQVATGRFRGLLGFDDIGSGGGENAFVGGVSFEDMETCGKHVKVTRGWNWMPICARALCTYMRDRALAAGPDGDGGPRINGIRQYRYIDLCMTQYRTRINVDGTVEDYLNTQIPAAHSCGLAFAGGINMLNQGAGTTPGYGCVPGENPAQCSFSPAEVRSTGIAMLSRADCLGFAIWAYNNNPAFWAQSIFQTVFEEIRVFAVNRTDPTPNIRGDLVQA